MSENAVQVKIEASYGSLQSAFTQAKAFVSDAVGGGSGGGGSITINLQAMDGESVKRLLMGNTRALADAIKRAQKD